MSYEFPISFLIKPVLNKEEAMSLALEMTNQITENDDIAKAWMEHEQHRFFLAFMSCGLHDDQLMLDRKMATVNMAIEKVVLELFTLRFTYWPNHKLLGVSCDKFLAERLDDMNSIYFQDANDQDYDYEEWSDDIPLFANLKKEAIVANIPIPENSSVGLEYYRRSQLYHDIFDTLHLNEWLYGRISDQFIRFAFQGITTSEMRIDFYVMAKRLLYRTEPFRIAKAAAKRAKSGG